MPSSVDAIAVPLKSLSFLEISISDGFEISLNPVESIS